MYSDREIKLGKILGIKVNLDYSWFWIFLLVTYSFSAQLLPSLTAPYAAWRYIVFGLIGSLLFFASVLAHELAHSLVARKQGENIEKITLFLFGGIANLEEEPKSASNEIKMAIIGPSTSILIGLLLIGLYYALISLNVRSLLVTTVGVVGYLNFILAFFNLLPGFPLDGGRILRGIIWSINNNLKRATKIATTGGKVVAGLLMLLGFYEFIFLNNLGGLWPALIGFFLYQAATTSWQRLIIRKKLENLKVKDILTQEPLIIEASASLKKLADEFRKGVREYILVEEDKIIGLVSLKELKKHSIEEDLRVKDIYTDLKNLKVFNIEEEAEKAFTDLVKTLPNVLLILENDKIINYLSLKNIRYYLLAEEE